MEELQEAERYSIAALFTLALFSVASYAEHHSADIGATWGEEEELEHEETHEKTIGNGQAFQDSNEPGGFWGRDLAGKGALLDAMYWQLGLPCFKWAGLKALPSVASDPDVLRSTVRSLIAVLDKQLADTLPPLTFQQEKPTVDVWDGILSSSDEEEVFDINAIKQGLDMIYDDKIHIGEEGCSKIENDIQARDKPETHKHDDSQNDLDVSPDCDKSEALPEQFAKEMQALQSMAMNEPHEEFRKKEYEALAHQVERVESEEVTFPSSPRCKDEVKREIGKHEIPVSPIAVAGIWELLQCVIGSTFAAGEALDELQAHSDAEDDKKKSVRDLKSKSKESITKIQWYDSRARAALRLVCQWLHVDSRKLATLELLLGNDRAPATTRPGRTKNVSDRYRYWKVGIAAVGGGALFAVTGGLAAPAIAAGVGSIIGVVPGAGAAAAAASISGFMSTQVGLAAVTTTMATAGAATTGSKMAYRTADVKDFGFFHLGDSLDASAKKHQDSMNAKSKTTADVGHLTGVVASKKETAATETKKMTASDTNRSWYHSWFGTSVEGKQSEQDIKLSPIPSLKTPKIEGIKLSTVVAISGWVTTKADYVTPWIKSLHFPASDRFALVWCIQELTSLSSALQGLITKVGAGQAAKFGVQHLVAGGAGLLTALGPTVLLGTAAGVLIENAWVVAVERAEKAGKLLADLLAQNGSAGRPVTLIAHSMGSKLLLSCLQELSQMNARGIVENVILMGTPVIPEGKSWAAARKVVAGRIINCYSSRDWLLSVMFWQSSAAGLTPVPTYGIENFNCSDMVGGHTEYLDYLEDILGMMAIV